MVGLLVAPPLSAQASADADAPPAPLPPPPPAAAESSAPSEAPEQRELPPPPPPSEEVEGTSFHQRFVLETALRPPPLPEPDLLRLALRGEYQARYTQLTDPRLDPVGTDGPRALGQTQRVVHWLRMTPRVQVGPRFEVVGQLDVPRGFFVGQETHDVNSAREPYAKRNPLELDPRWLYAELRGNFGLVRLGQQPSHWGLGILANDGNHPTLFGDYNEGSIVERLLFASKPGGLGSPITLAVAGDLVFRDPLAELTEEQYALQGVLALIYGDRDPNPYTDRPPRQIGAYVVYRHQTQEAKALPGRVFDEDLDVFGIDSSGQFDAPLPGGDGHVFGAYEVVYLTGSTSLTRTLEQQVTNEREEVRSWGAVAQLGAVLTRGQDEKRWGRMVLSLEWGWASGDADPNDGVTKRFVMDPNHNVGLILFDELMAWKTARASNTASDPDLVNRPAPGSDRLPTNGGIAGATYLNPTVLFRPVRQLDLKAGIVIAQATADFVDPVKVSTEGRFLNYDGGPATSRDLGIELDGGVEYRFKLDYGMGLSLGAQGAVLFPGRAFANAAGKRVATQGLGVGRFGLYF